MVSLRSALKATNCAVENMMPEDDDPNICPACHKRFKTSCGVQSHLQTAKSCTWYKKGKLKALIMPGQFDEAVLFQDLPEAETLPDGLPEEEDNVEAYEVMEDFHERILELIPPDDDFDADAPGPSQQSPSSSPRDTSPPPENDDRFVEEHPTAGHHIRVVPTLHERWKKLFGGEDLEEDLEGVEGVESAMDVDIDMEDKFAPFASELDWRVARWAVQEGIGHKSFDRLMAIPGVGTTISYVIITFDDPILSGS